jgi:hypothetical protein
MSDAPNPRDAALSMRGMQAGHATDTHAGTEAAPAPTGA